jgi:L-lysine 6-transaminase
MIDELKRYVVFEPYPFVVDLSRSRGMTLVTADGDQVVDWGGFYASRLLGLNHPRMAEPDYLRRLQYAANAKTANPDYPTAECLEYYRLVHSLAPKCLRNPGLEVYAVNSGAEAVENMMKYMINLHQQELLGKGKMPPQARRFIYFDQAFHGRTVFALNVTNISGNPVLTKGFQGFAQGNIQVPFPAVHSDLPASENDARTHRALDTIEDVLSRYADEIAGIVVEPIQGAGGHRLAQKAFFRQLSELAHRNEVFLGFDEVQTAGGQTGTVFAIDQFDLPHPPTAVAVAKKFGNGVVFMHHTMEDRGVLDSTWGGSGADMVRFVQEWKIVTGEKLIEQVPGKTDLLVGELRRLQKKYPGLPGNIRGMGLYQGFSLKEPSKRGRLVDLALAEENLLLLEGGQDSVRLRPPLDVTPEDIRQLGEKLDRLFAALA